MRKLKAEANLEMAMRMQKIEEEEADRRLERQKRILLLELEAKQNYLNVLYCLQFLSKQQNITYNTGIDLNFIQNYRVWVSNRVL